MKLPDMLELAGRNLRESLLRNSLTTLGIGVGVASLVAMLSLGIGLQQLASKRLSRSGLFDTVLVTSREFDRLSRAERQAEREQTAAPARRLDEAARREIEKIAHVNEVYPEIRFVADVRHRARSEFVGVAALPRSARDREAFEGMQGRYFSDDAAEEAILRSDLAGDIAENPASLVGKEIVLRYAQLASPGQVAQNQSPPAPAQSGEEGANPVEEMITSGFSVVRREQTLRVVGIVEHDPDSGMRGGRTRVWIPMQTAQNMNVMVGSDLREMVRSSLGGPSYLALTVRAERPTQVQAVEDSIKKMGFATFSLLDATRSLRRFFTILDLFLGIFGSLALAVASLGIVNTLVMAILERRREIGIMKAVGASDGDVKQIFFSEAAAMGLLGGLLGVAMGWSMGRLINFGANIYLKRQELPPERFWAVPWWLVAAAVAFSIVVSLASGLYPAARAARLDPVQALRYE